MNFELESAHLMEIVRGRFRLRIFRSYAEITVFGKQDRIYRFKNKHAALTQFQVWLREDYRGY